MAELKTKLTDQSVSAYLDQIADETIRKDCIKICQIMEDVTKSGAKMWRSAIVGVGDYLYKYENGRTNNWFMMGFSPRKQNISLYILGCDAENKAAILSRFGKHKTGKGCIYVKTLADINLEVLRELCELSYQNLKKS
jgi:hypothetical protein